MRIGLSTWRSLSRFAIDQSLTGFFRTFKIPRSPKYHQWLTPKEFNRRFGPRDADVDGVVDWLRGEQFSVDMVNRPEHYVRFHGTVSQAERTFSVSIETFGSGQVFANTSDQVIPVRFASVRIGGRPPSE
jgi:subtilase family serine protease